LAQNDDLGVVDMVFNGSWCAFFSPLLSLGLDLLAFPAYTMFNVFLPKLLETDSDSEVLLEDALWDVLIYTIGGCPGSIVSLERIPVVGFLTSLVIARGLSGRITPGPAVVTGRKYIQHRPFMRVVRTCQVAFGCSG
jgi:hypothetical protein